MGESRRHLADGRQPFGASHRRLRFEQLTIRLGELVGRGLRSASFRAAGFGELIRKETKESHGEDTEDQLTHFLRRNILPFPIDQGKEGKVSATSQRRGRQSTQQGKSWSSRDEGNQQHPVITARDAVRVVDKKKA